MVDKKIIKIELDTSRAIKQIKALNKSLKSLNTTALEKVGKSVEKIGDAAEKTGKKIKKASKETSKFEKIIASIKTSFGGLAGTAKKAGKAVAVGFGAVIAGVVLMMKGLNEGLDRISAGLEHMIKMRYARRAFGDLTKIIQRATSGLVAFDRAGDFIRKGKGLGLGDIQLQKLAKIGAAGGLLGGLGAAEGLKRITDAITDGSEGPLKDISSSLSVAVKKALDLAGSITMVQRRQIVINTLMREYKNIMQETAGVLEDPFTRLLGFIRTFKEESKGLIEVLKGVGIIAAAILAPLGAGLAAFAIGGPVIGAIASVIGLAITGTASAFAIRQAQKAGGTEQSGMSGGIAALRVGEALLSSFVTMLGGKDTGVDLDPKAMDALGLTNQKWQSMLKGVRTFALGLNKFADSFFETLNFDYIKAKFKLAFGKKFDSDGIIGIFGAVGKGIAELINGISNMFDPIKKAITVWKELSDTFGWFAEQLDKLFMVFGLNKEEAKDLRSSVFGPLAVINNIKDAFEALFVSIDFWYKKIFGKEQHASIMTVPMLKQPSFIEQNEVAFSSAEIMELGNEGITGLGPMRPGPHDSPQSDLVAVVREYMAIQQTTNRMLGEFANQLKIASNYGDL